MSTDEHLTKKLISIVVPIYCEESNLRLLIERLDIVTGTLTEFNFDYVLVNDGSNDGSWELIKKLASESSRVVGIDFSRNFGKEVALTAGVHQAKNSDAVICIDGDLQHPPELIPQMVADWRAGAEVVATVRTGTEKESIVRKVGSRIFFWVMAHVSDLSMVYRTTDFRLYDRRVVSAFCQLNERGRIFRGMMDWMGFRRVYLEFQADARRAGTATYSYRKLLGLAINSITSFSLFPLKVVGYLGITITLTSAILLIWMMLSYLIYNQWIYTPLAIVVVANTLLIGIVLIAIGLIAVYIGSIHTEAINRPLYFIRQTIGIDGDRPLDH
jgi:dolichol-phosphate mannosyltransferase